MQELHSLIMEKEAQVNQEIDRGQHTEHWLAQTQDKLKKTEMKMKQMQLIKMKDL